MVSANTAVAANTAKVGYTEALVSADTAVAANTAKVGYTEVLVSANTAVAANTAKVGYTEALVSANTAVAANTAKVGYTEALVSANTAKNTNVSTDLSISGTTGARTTESSDGDDAVIPIATTSVSGVMSKAIFDQYVVNNAKTGITATQRDAIVTNTAKTRITSAQSSAITANTAKVGVTTHGVGDTYGGGIVFYIYDGGQHGLIAATANQSTGIRWYGGSDTNTRARADGIGADLKNTAIIIANQGAVDGNAFAATICNEYSVTAGGVAYGDWYLPSKYEFALLYAERSRFSGLSTSTYWSSTEYASGVA